MQVEALVSQGTAPFYFLCHMFCETGAQTHKVQLGKLQRRPDKNPAVLATSTWEVAGAPHEASCDSLFRTIHEVRTRVTAMHVEKYVKRTCGGLRSSASIFKISVVDTKARRGAAETWLGGCRIKREKLAPCSLVTPMLVRGFATFPKPGRTRGHTWIEFSGVPDGNLRPCWLFMLL